MQSSCQPPSLHPYCSVETALVTTPTASTKAASETTPTASKAATKTTKAASKTTRKKVDDDSELLTIPIDQGVLLRLRYINASRQNFATNIMRNSLRKLSGRPVMSTGCLAKVNSIKIRLTTSN